MQRRLEGHGEVLVDHRVEAADLFGLAIHAHDVPALQVGEHSRVVRADEGLAPALAALHLWKLANAPDELVGAGRRVPWLSGLLAHEAGREHVSTTAEELPE